MSEVPISRRVALGAGFATGLVLATGTTQSVSAKIPWKPEESPEYAVAFDFVIKQNWRAGPGYWAVIYAGDSFKGKPTLIGDPQLMPKAQAGTVPIGWGAESGSIVVGASAVLRLFHKIDGQDTHITLLPFEQFAKVDTFKLTDGQSSWKLYPAGELRPPY